MLARVAVLATLLGRGVAPALPGLAVGIAPFIAAGSRIAAFLSQLVAAGGVAAAARLAGRALRQPQLDLGYRLVALPASAIVVALVMAAWAHPLEPELCRMMAVAAILASLAAAVASLRDIRTRASGLLLACASASGLSHLIAREFVSRAAERLDSGALHWAVGVATLATALDLTALGLVLVYLSKQRKSLLGAALVLVSALAIGLVAAHGAAPGAGLARVFAQRVLAQMSRAPAAALPVALRFATTTALLFGAGLCVSTRSVSRKTNVVLALCLLSLGAPDMPLPALWLVLASVLAPQQAGAAPLEPTEPPASTSTS